MLHEVSFASYNGRDQVQGWIYVPACKPKGIVQVIHGFGEHSRRYLHMISAFMDAGYIVAADDHVGHGKTAMVNDVWGDWGDKGPHTFLIRTQHGIFYHKRFHCKIRGRTGRGNHLRNNGNLPRGRRDGKEIKRSDRCRTWRRIRSVIYRRTDGMDV